MIDKEQLQAIAQTAETDADTLAVVYQETLKARLQTNLQAVNLNTVQQIAAAASKLDQQIIRQVAAAYADQAKEGAIQVTSTPIRSIRLELTDSAEEVEIASLLPTPPSTSRFARLRAANS